MKKIGYILLIAFSVIAVGCTGDGVSATGGGDASQTRINVDDGATLVIDSPTTATPAASSGGSDLPICDGTSVTAATEDRCVEA